MAPMYGYDNVYDNTSKSREPRCSELSFRDGKEEEVVALACLLTSAVSHQ